MNSSNRLNNFLSSLSDHELAIFIGYRFDGFIPGSQKKIINETINRGLTKDKIKELFSTVLNSNIEDKTACCPRCGSERLFVETDYEIRESKFVNYDVAIDTNRCRLCGYNPDKEQPKNIFERIKRVFVNNKSERAVNWHKF